MSSCDVYCIYKDKFELERYLLCTDGKIRRSLCKFRTNNSRIPKVIGRYNNIPRNQRYCTLCLEDQKIGDAYHLLLECKNPVIHDLRKKYIPKYFYCRPNMLKCIELLQCKKVHVIRNLGTFLKNTLCMF